jgi:hypothetical protein
MIDRENLEKLRFSLDLVHQFPLVRR